MINRKREGRNPLKNYLLSRMGILVKRAKVVNQCTVLKSPLLIIKYTTEIKTFLFQTFLQLDNS